MERQIDKNVLPEQVWQVISIAENLFHNQISGIYLYGSATVGGLRPDSDIDILIITTQEMGDDIRDSLTRQLLTVSGPVGCAEKRPLEVTVIRQGDIVPWNFPPRCEYMYGEWLREGMEAGKSPQPCHDPDIAILLWQARKNSMTLKGLESKKLIPCISFQEIEKAIQSSLPGLVSSYEGDERNVLLTLSRMWFTLETEEMASKDIAAEWAMSKLPDSFVPLMELAMNGYLGKCIDKWGGKQAEALPLVDFMRKKIAEYAK